MRHTRPGVRMASADGKSVFGMGWVARNPGFTMIELLLVILIVGTMAGLSAPKLRGSYERMRLTESANSLRSAIRMARETSITEGIPHRVALDLVDRAYWVEKQSTDGSRYDRLQSRWGRGRGLPDGIHVASAPEAIEFGPDGRVAGFRRWSRGADDATGYLRHGGDASARAGRIEGGPGSAVSVIVLMNELEESRSVIIDNVTGHTWVEMGQNAR